MSLADRRRLPFFQVVKTDVAAIQASATKRQLPYVRSVYFALLEAANDQRADAIEATRRELADQAGVGRTKFDECVEILLGCGVLAVESGQGSGTANLWLLLTADDTGGGARATGRGVPALRAGGARSASTLKETGQEVEKTRGENPPNPPRVKISGKPVNGESWALAGQILDEFNRQTSRDLRLLTSAGQPSEAAKRIYGRVRAYPDITFEQHGRIIAATLASRWWGSDKPSVGVVYGPKVFEDNIARRPTSSNPGAMGGSGPPSAEWMAQLEAKLARDRAR